jgi:hypothetical protein
MSRNDDEYRQDSADDSDIEGAIKGQINGPRLTAKEKGKGRANPGNKKINGKSKEVKDES